MPRPMMPQDSRYRKVEPPAGIKDVPRYLKELLTGFFSRFIYILKLVWDTGHWILFAMSFVALFQGLVPVISSIISKNILNELQSTAGAGAADSFFSSKIFYLLIFFFTVQVLWRVVGNISGAVNRIAGEKVVKQVKTMIMNKSKEIDLASFDQVKFYEKLENANREAGNRPIQILSHIFSIISTVIEFISYIIIMVAEPDLWWSIFIIAAISVPSALINFIYRRKNFNYVFRRSKDRRQMNYYSDILVNKDLVKEIRMFDLGDEFSNRYHNVFTGYYKGLVKLIRDESIWHTVIAIITSVSNLILYVLIAIKVFNGDILIGDYALYTGAITSIANCIGSLINNSAFIYEGTLFIDNLIAFMNEKTTVVPRLSVPEKVKHNASHTIEFRHVSFKYPDTDRYVLKDINLMFRPAKRLFW